MFRNMRRNEKATDFMKAEELLKSKNYGILSVNGDNGYPYGVPVNFAYEDGKIYFHSTSESSHKIESIEKNEKVCFTVVAEHDLIPEKLDTMYTSVIAFGRGRIIRKKEETRSALKTFLLGITPEMASKSEAVYEAQKEKFVMVEITVEHISGKIGR